MILILGGTTEGRLAVRVADEAGSPYFYSTKGHEQQVTCRNGTHLTGGMDGAALTECCRAHSIRLLVDAAHPFATELHRHVAEAARQLHLPVVRIERQYPPRSSDIVWCDDYDDALRRLEQDGIRRLLALTGVQTIGRLRPYWQHHTCWFRILPRPSSMALAREQGFDERNLVFYQENDEDRLVKQLSPDALLTKESGESGGFAAKVTAARAAGIPIYAVKRPPLPDGFRLVTGEHGLRKAIEQAIPGFFPLRSGFTTGACATAATKAALLALLGQTVGEEVTITLPDGEHIALPLHEVTRENGAATAAVQKDAGDDPDITNGRLILSTVRFSSCPGIRFLPGEGVGRVTLPGLGLPIGAPAINPTPRRMMEQEVAALYPGGVDIILSIPGGRELALRTFNPKLGVVDGLSIIGTSGIVRPFSSEAFVETIRREIEVFRAVGGERLVINSGARSERFLRDRYPNLPPQAFVHYGNYIGATLRAAADQGIDRLTLGIMIGKAVKLAEGQLDTHSRQHLMNKIFLQRLAAEAGCSEAARSVIERLTLARELWTLLSAADLDRFLTVLVAACRHWCRTAYPNGELTLLLMDEEGQIRCG